MTVLVAPAADAATAIGFEPAVQYNAAQWTGSGSGSIASADFNVDGHPDLVVVDAPSKSVSVLLNNGDGTFVMARKTTASLLDVYAVVAGDFNGDGRPDVAAASDLASLTGGLVPDLAILLGVGDGTFRAASRYRTALLPQQIAATDFDLDGILDLAAVGSEGGVAVLFGNGDGSFTRGPTAWAGSGTTSIVAADLNGDGHPDLAVSAGMVRFPQLDEGTVWISTWNPSARSLSTPIGLPVASVPEQVTAGDLDHDGRIDLVTANAGASVISILRNTPTGFAPYRTAPVGRGGAGIAIADFNNDGRADIAVGRSVSNQITVLAGTGNGGFANAVDFSGPGDPQAMSVDDFNGDGWLDIAAAVGPGIDVLLNAGPQG